MYQDSSLHKAATTAEPAEIYSLFFQKVIFFCWTNELNWGALHKSLHHVQADRQRGPGTEAVRGSGEPLAGLEL